jgi:hypothetical protein
MLNKVSISHDIVNGGFMKWLVLMRRALMALAALVLLVGVILLLNITAPNPTGRRYSSAMPMQSEGTIASSRLAGDEAERILAKDLRLVGNNSGKIQCICKIESSTTPNGCHACIAYIHVISEQYRRPDFVTTHFIAESKNSVRFPSARDVAEILDYTAAAQQLKIPLWIYIRHDTEITNTALIEKVETTGGGVVRYFTVPGYADPVDEMARYLVSGSLLVLLVGVALEYFGARQHQTVRVPVKPVPIAGAPQPKAPKFPRDPLGKVGDAEGFMGRMRDKAQRDLDISGAHEDL